MARISHDTTLNDQIVAFASEARGAGKTWKEVFACAQKAGYRGSESSLQKVVRAQMTGKTPAAKKPARGGFKNSAKTIEAASSADNSFSRELDLSAATRSESAVETLESIQNRLPVLREGTFYSRPISLFQGSFYYPHAGEIVAWSRILGREEAVCITNSNGQFPRGADVLVDCTLNPAGSFLTVIHLSDEVAKTDSKYALGEQLPVQRRDDGTAFVAVRNILPGQILVLTNMAALMACAE